MNEPRPKRFPLSLDKVATGVARAQPVRELLRPQAPLQQAEQDRRRLASPAATPGRCTSSSIMEPITEGLEMVCPSPMGRLVSS